MSEVSGNSQIVKDLSEVLSQALSVDEELSKKSTTLLCTC